MKRYIHILTLAAFTVLGQRGATQTITYAWPNQPCSNMITCAGGCSACNAGDNTDAYFTGTPAVWHGLQPCPMPDGGADCAVFTDGWPAMPDTTTFVLISVIAWQPVYLDSIIITHRVNVGGPSRLVAKVGINTTLPTMVYSDVMTSLTEQSTVITDIGCVAADSGMVYGFAQLLLQAYDGSGDFVLDRVRFVGADCGLMGVMEVRPDMGSGDRPMIDILGRQLGGEARPAAGLSIGRKTCIITIN